MTSSFKQHIIHLSVVIALGTSAVTAQALTVGKITGLSSLGQPLQAEIDLPSITAAEAASLNATIAGSDNYAKSGLEYSPSMANAQISLQRRSSGQAYLRLTTATPMSDPFVNLVVELAWDGGRAVRDFTLLLDPANVQMDKPVVVNNAPVLAPNLSPAPIQNRSASSIPQTDVKLGGGLETPQVQKQSATTETNPNTSTLDRLRVKRGQTAGQIARQLRASSTHVSLDQMLVALVRNNPDAFINGNVNRIKAGAVLDLPTADDAQVVSSADARKMVIAQSQDFNAYRRQLAVVSARAPEAGNQRQASGQIQAQVNENKPVTQSADKLTLSKPGGKNAESQLAQTKQAQENKQRAAEVTQNAKDLSQLATQAGVNSTAVASNTPANSATGTPAAGTAETSTTPIPSAADINALANADATSATETPITEPIVQAPAPQPAAEESSIFGNLWATLTGIPNLLPGLGALMLALLGWFFWRNRQKAKQAALAETDDDYDHPMDSPLIYSDDSGQTQINAEYEDDRTQVVVPTRHIDKEAEEITQFNRENNTALRRATDPMAEAQVYLDFGREQEAKETLEAAFEANPAHVPVALKLLDVYGRMGDQVRFSKLSSQVEQLTGGQGLQWQEVATMAAQHQMPLPTSSLTAKMAQASTPAKVAPAVQSTVAATVPTPAPDREDFESIDLTIAPSFAAAPTTPVRETEDFEAIDLTILPTSNAQQPLNVNLNDFSLDLNSPAAASAPTVISTDPWATKLMLAKEFREIGDEEGAKTIAQEVLERTTDGALKTAAQNFLSTLKT